MVAVLDAGLGAAGLLRRPVRGRVVSVHRKAAYLRLDGSLIALVAPGVDPGPLHVRCTALPALRPGDAVTGNGAGLTGRRWAVRGPGPVWRGSRPGPAALAARRDEELVRAAAVDREGVASDATRRLAHGGRFAGLDDVVAAVGGRGPGLTPAGDDVLAGVFLVARIAGGPRSEDRLLALAAGIPTTEVARAFLCWAARGQSIAPAHDWLLAVATGDRAGARRALTRLHGLGADSGRHLASGLALGIGQLPRVASQSARAGSGPVLRQ